MKEHETKFVERYDYWMCEKCGYKEKLSAEPFLNCPKCQREIIENVPLGAGVVW